MVNICLSALAAFDNQKVYKSRKFVQDISKIVTSFYHNLKSLPGDIYLVSVSPESLKNAKKNLTLLKDCSKSLYSVPRALKKRRQHMSQRPHSFRKSYISWFVIVS